MHYVDESSIITGSVDETVKLWSHVQKQKEVKKDPKKDKSDDTKETTIEHSLKMREEFGGHNLGVVSVGASPDGKSKWGVYLVRLFSFY